MERFLWIISYFPVRINLFLFAVADYLILKPLYQRGVLMEFWNAKKYIIIVCICAILTMSISMAIWGGKLGYKYVEMTRSRRWHYRATTYNKFDSEFSNTMYWAGKMAGFPILLGLLIICIVGIYWLKI